MASTIRVLPLALAAAFAPLPTSAEGIVLPPEVTPALKAACEQDVRRLCIIEGATLSTVRSCVVRRYSELSARCKVQIAVAGLTPSK